MPKSVHLYELSEAMQLVLENGGEVSFVTRGFSMLPLLRNHMDTVFLRKPTRAVRRGDVLFYRRTNGAFVLHRVIGVRKDGFVLRGDNQTEKEYGIQLEQVLAVLTAVRRKEGRTIRTTDAGYRLYCFALPLVRLFRLHIYPQYVRFLAPILKKIKK